MTGTNPFALRGSCHCGATQVRAVVSFQPDTFALRKCDCSFCVKHGAAYISDASGSVTYTTKPGSSLRRYHQYEDGIAEFLICDTCGVVVGVTYTDSNKRIYSAVNGMIFLNQKFADPLSVSPQKLSKDEKTERWKKLWFSDVRFD